MHRPPCGRYRARSESPWNYTGMFSGWIFGGFTLTIGRRGFAVYRDGKVVAQYTAIGRR